jgi:hypothetical protein
MISSSSSSSSSRSSDDTVNCIFIHSWFTWLEMTTLIVSAHLSPSSYWGNSVLHRVTIMFNVSTGVQHSIQHLSPTVWLDGIHQRLHMTPEKVVQRRKMWWCRRPSNWSTLPNPTVWKVLIQKCQLHAKMRTCGNLVTATYLAWLAEEHLPTSVAALPVGKASSTAMSNGLQA